MGRKGTVVIETVAPVRHFRVEPCRILFHFVWYQEPSRAPGIHESFGDLVLIHSYICSICRWKNRACQSRQQTLPNHWQRTRRNWSHTLPHCYPWCLRLPERVPPNWTWIQLPRYQINCRSDLLSAKRAISCSHVLEEVDQWTWHAIWVLIVESMHSSTRIKGWFHMTSSKNSN